MNWQNDFHVEGDERMGGRTAAGLLFLIFLLTGASYFHYNRHDVQAVSEVARERIGAMKQTEGG